MRRVSFSSAGSVKTYSLRLKSLSLQAGKLRALPDVSKAQQPSTLPQDLKKLDKLLRPGSSEDAQLQATAVSTVQGLHTAGCLPAFGNARQIPKRVYTLEELRLNKIDTSKLLSPQEETVSKVEVQLQVAYAGLVAFTAFYGGFDVGRAGGLVFATLFLFSLDQVALMGGMRALVTDTATRVLAPEYRMRVAYHEAGHFLIAYLCGLLPLAYTLSSLDAFINYRAVNIQAGCRFADAAFNEEVKSGTLRASSLNQFTCVALAGICAEYVKFGASEGGTSDIQQLDFMLKSLQFTQKKADGEVRWAVLNNVDMLRRHAAVHEALAKKMADQASVGECLLCIEQHLQESDDV